MVKAAHIIVSDRVLKDVQSQISWNINRAAYLFGSIAPDFNCIYPMHTFNATIKRFKKRLWRMEKYNSILIKSFTLGVIMHYICDYFCYAHNIRQPNPKHAIYETIMKHHISTHTKNLGLENKELQEQWDELKQHTIESMTNNGKTDENKVLIDKALRNISLIGIDHIEYIVKLVEKIHDSYIEKTDKLDTSNWYKSIPKIELDLQYSEFICKNIALIITGYTHLSYEAY